ncbi:MAG: 4-hydroxy-tetrahydrodipicolinate synthase [Deltaproteobacteria bacterium]|nr:4-hydroxy-tetrahydrodipicolinate synthase [Deltaproteobacteria bacterium]
MLVLKGSMVAMATPFKNGALDEAAFATHARFLVDNGTSVLVPMGTTGESVTCSDAEQARAVRIAVENKGRAIVLGGAGSNDTAHAIHLVKGVRDAGADGTLVVTPYYNRPTQDGLVAHYKAIAKAHPGFPIVAYNVPSRTGVDLLPETCARLCEIPEVVGLKEATGNMARTVDIFEKCGDRLQLISGDDFTIAPFIACGGLGVISVSANIAPRQVADLCDAALAGKREAARDLQTRLNPLHRALFSEASPTPVKAGLSLMGRFTDEIRLPLLPMTEGPKAKLREAMKQLGIL